ncbi:hypothetical protein HQ545_03065 [Candidatus Woesearchaeota archaeon]|nr:hypothetical protein [Candidatus Woesearchaeota archaeon]
MEKTKQNIDSPENSEENSGFPHELTRDERIKGGQSKSIQKSISAKIRSFNRPELNCQACKHRCFLYDAEEEALCFKGLILTEIRRLARSNDPFELFDEIFSSLADLKLETLRSNEFDPDGKITFAKKKMYFEKLIEAHKLKFGNNNDDGLKQLSHSDIASQMRKYKEIVKK